MRVENTLPGLRSTLGPKHTRHALWQRRLRLEEKFRHERLAGEGDIGDKLSRSRLPEWGLRSVGLWARGIRNAHRIRLVHHTLHLPKLPDFLIGYRVLYVADFHFHNRFPGFAPLVRDLLSTAQADVCLFGGDYRFAHDGDYAHVFRDMATVLEGIQTRHGIHAILGNHDLSGFVEPFHSLGIDLLVNENRRIDVDGGSFWIAGVDDQHRFHCESLSLATEGIPAGSFRILLAHSPELAPAAPDHEIDLYLCGHTHWGQIRFPFLGALTYNSRCPSRFCMGLWESDAMLGYTTAGIGTTDLPVRFNCPPEACLLTLTRV